MTYDAKFVYQDIAKGAFGDWQSPVMTVLWRVIDPVAPGAGSMFLLTATAYWLGFGLVAFALARRSARLALLLPVLALAPPAFVLVGILWRDVLFAATWLLAAAIVFAAAGCGARFRVPAQVLGLALCALGVLLRPNALIAAPILAAYILWPAQMSFRRSAILFVPAVAGFFALVQVVYYGALDATRQHPLHAIMVFDLGGISHFSKENQFPVTWSAAESALLLNGCYQPTQWDIYWRLEPCDFVMRKLEREEKLFGTPVLTEAWAHAVMRHPLAYLEHRTAFMWNVLAGDNLVMWLADVEHPTETVFTDRPAFVALVRLQDLLKPTPLFRTGSWLLLCIAVCGFAWRRRDSPEAAFAFGICGSATVYVLTSILCRCRVGFPLRLLGRSCRYRGWRRCCVWPAQASNGASGGHLGTECGKCEIMRRQQADLAGDHRERAALPAEEAETGSQPKSWILTRLFERKAGAARQD